MIDDPPFVLLPLADDRYELRAFSDDSKDPIILELGQADGRRLGVAVADLLTAPDSPGVERLSITLTIAGRRVMITGTAECGLRLAVDR